MKRVILLTLSLLFGISSHSQSEWGTQTTHSSIVLTITTAWIKGQDYSELYKNRNQTITLSCTTDGLYLTNKGTDGESFGALSDISLQNTAFSYVLTAKWHYQNSYDSNTGIIKIRLMVFHSDKTFSLSYNSDGVTLGVTLFKGYALTNNMKAIEDHLTGVLTTTADIMPSFQGGDINTFRQWIAENVKYPQEALENGVSGRVVASFVINADGKLSDIEIIQSPAIILSTEVIRVLGLAPKWTPGFQNGRPVKVKFTTPCDFNISDEYGTPTINNSEKNVKTTANFDRGVNYYQQGDYNHAITYLHLSLQGEKHEIGLVYTYLSYSYYKLNKINDAYIYATKAVDYFTPLSAYLENNKDLLSGMLIFKANFDFNYSQEREDWKPYATSAINIYTTIINSFPDSLNITDYQEMNARCGVLKYMLGQSDYKGYLQNGGTKGQEILHEIDKKHRQSTTVNRQKPKQLVKDKNFKIE